LAQAILAKASSTEDQARLGASNFTQ